MVLLNKTNLRDEKGFAFIAALLAMLIMVSLGVLIFTLTTRDVRATVKLMGEKKAFSVAEGGLQRVLQYYDMTNSNWTQSSPDPAAGPSGYFNLPYGDSASCYTYTTPAAGLSAANKTVALAKAGYSLGGSQSFGVNLFYATVTGINTNYMSTSVIDMGLGNGPNPNPTSTTYN